MKDMYLTVVPWGKIESFSELHEAIEYLQELHHMKIEEAIDNITRITTGNFSYYIDNNGRVREL